MNTSHECRPPQRIGVWALSLLGLGALALGVAALGQMAHRTPGGGWVSWMVAGVCGWGLFAWAAYMLAALRQARYRFSRDGIELQWGLRTAHIPMNRVLWVEAASALKVRLRLPFFWWPGALRGVRHVPGLGPVEFLAASPRHLLLIATPERVYAISPAQPQTCLEAVRALLELGALNPLPEAHHYPAMLLRTLWSDRAARLALLALLAANGLLLVRASLRSAALERVVMNYDPAGAPLAPVPAVRLLFLPLLNAWLSLSLLILGTVFHRRQGQRLLAFLCWLGAVASSLVLLAALEQMR